MKQNKEINPLIPIMAVYLIGIAVLLLIALHTTN
jgi:hypothetical protein